MRGPKIPAFLLDIFPGVAIVDGDMKKIPGYAIISVPAWALFGIMAYNIGLRNALYVVGLVGGGAGLVVLCSFAGIRLIED